MLPHLVCVIKLLDDQWAPEMAKLVRPKKAWGIVPAIGWAEAALRVLREAEDYLSVSEMLDAIVEEHDEVDLAEVGARQGACLAISRTLLQQYRHLLVADPEGGRWALASRVAQFND